MKTYSFINKKGGVGKTTIVINTAYALANRYGARVLVIDNDDQGNDTDFFGVEADCNLADIMMNTVSIKDAIKHTRYENIDIIPADIDLASANVDIIKEDLSDNLLLQRSLQEVADMYDICLIDNPPRIDSLTVVNSIIASDEVVVVSLPDVFSVSGVKQMISLIESAKQFRPNLKYRGVVLNMASSDTESANMIERLKGISPIFKTRLRKTDNYKVRVRTATARQQSIYEYSPRCGFAQDLVKFTDELLNMEG